MRKIFSIMFLVITFLEIGVGIYFLWGYYQAAQFGVTGLGPVWSQLTAFWWIVGLTSLLFGFVTLLTALLLIKRKKLGFWFATISIALFIKFLLSLKPLILQ